MEDHKQWLSGKWLLIIIGLSLGLLGWANTWEAIQQQAKTIDSVQSDFIQEKHLSILETPLISTGRFFFQAPFSLRWEYVKPVRSVLFMHNGKVHRYLFKDHQVIEDQSPTLQAMQVVLQEITQWIHGRFQANPDFSAELIPGSPSKIILTPKAPAMARLINRIELNLSQTPGLMASVVIHEDQVNYTLLKFTNSRLNPILDPALFQTPVQGK